VRRHSVRILGLAVGLLSFVVYLRTLYPGVGGGGDTIKFQYLGRVLGTAHTPGYPLYVLVSHAFSHLPFGTLAYRMNAMSAFFASCTVMLAFAILLRLKCRPWISASAALALAFGQSLWGKAVGAEVYTFSAAFGALNVWLALRCVESGRPRDLYALAAVFGLGLGNHLSAAMILPAIAVFILVARPSLVRPKTVLASALLVMAGLLQYGFIIVRSLQEAPFVEARATNARELYDVLRAAPYADSIFTFTMNQLISERVPLLWRLFRSEFGPLGLLFLGAGILTMVVRRVAAAWLLVLGAAGFIFLALNVDADIDGFLVAAFVLSWIVAGVGMNAAWSFLSARRRAAGWAAVLLVLIVPAWQLQANYRVNDHHGRTYETRYLNALFAVLEDRSAVVREAYSIDQMILYKLAGEDAAGSRTILLIPADPATVQRHAADGFAVYAFGETRALMEGRGLGFDPIQLVEPGSDGAPGQPIDMAPLPLFRATRRTSCLTLGNAGWRDISGIPSDTRLVLRVDNYRPFESQALLYVGTRVDGPPPALVVAQGPGAPTVSVRTFRTAHPNEASDLSAMLTGDGMTGEARLLAIPVVHRLELRVNDNGESETAALTLGTRPDLTLMRVSVDLNNPMRASVCGWAGKDLLQGRREESVPIGEEGRAFFGQGWLGADATSIGDVRWTSSADSEVLLPVGRTAPQRLTLRVKPFGDPAVLPRELVPTLNGKALAGRPLEGGWRDYAWELPAGSVHEGFNRLGLTVVVRETRRAPGQNATIGLQAITLEAGVSQ
jgi:hypothetical protein